MDFVPISTTRFATAGRFGGTWSPPMARAAVVVSDTTGALIRSFRPRSTYPQDYTPFLQALSRTPDGNLYFAMHENAQLFPPNLFNVFEPNRLHVYKLDTSLNVLCEHIVDGFADNAYYYLNRIKATDDGGFMLMGGRRNFDDPSGYFEAWARKFGPSDCTVGVEERQTAAGATLFPNPGREGFTLLLNGEALQGTLLLHDALGRACGSVPIRQGQARFDAQALATGVYVYHAQDMKGRTLATGWWVKE